MPEPKHKKTPRYLLEDFDMTYPGGRMDLVFNPANGERPLEVFKSRTQNADGSWTTVSKDEKTIPVEVAVGLACAQYVSKALSVSGRFRDQVLAVLPKFIGSLNQMGELMAGMINDVDVVLDEGTMDALLRSELMTMAGGLMAVAEGREAVMRSVIPEITSVEVEKRGAVMSRARRHQFEKLFMSFSDFAKDSGIDVAALIGSSESKAAKPDPTRVEDLMVFVVKADARFEMTEAQLKEFDVRLQELDKRVGGVDDQVAEAMRKAMTPTAGIHPDEDVVQHDLRDEVVKSDAGSKSAYEY